MTIQENVSLKDLNTFHIDVVADYFVRIESVEELLEAIDFAKEKAVPFMILGGGSNVLFSDQYKGVIIKNDIQFYEETDLGNGSVLVKSGAGNNWHQFVLQTLENGWYGLENLSLIPGTVGASPIQNIGAYGVEVKDVFHSLKALNIETRELEIFKKQDCNFDYRYSVFKGPKKGAYIIIDVTFVLSSTPNIKTEYGTIQAELNKKEITNPTPKDVSDAVIAIRSSKLPDPNEIGNAGSFFKNPVIKRIDFEKIRSEHPKIVFYDVDETHVKVPAGWLIDQAGWKGKTFGEIGVHRNQALVLVNYGKGKGEEIKALALNIQKDIKEKYQIDISPEVNFI